MAHYKTWQEECAPRMLFRGDGPVGFCVLWNLIGSVTERMPSEFGQLGVVGNLRTPLGVSWLLRGLWQMPQIRKLVIWGSDLTGSGQALLRLWQEGVQSGHKVPEFGWQIDELIPAEAIDELRSGVELVDCRKWDLADAVGELNWQGEGREREKRDFPPVPVPDLHFWPSRGSMIHIEAPDPPHGWLGALQALMHCGLPRDTRKGERLAHLFDLAVSFPVPESEELHQCFDFSAEDMERYVAQILSPERPQGVDYWYGERIQNWHGHNQLEEVVRRLKIAPDTKRATIAILEAPDLETLEDAPCFTSATFAIVEDRLHGSYVFRSHDIYEGWPFNIYAVLRLHREVARRLGCRLGRATFHSQNAQIYERHWERALQKLRAFGPSLERLLEFLKFRDDPAGNFVFVITEQKTVKCNYMNFRHDQILWEVEHRDPKVVVSWIVESIPWLTPQHVRYLGVEEEKLRRAIASGEEYIQG